jgi:predicted ATPase
LAPAGQLKSTRFLTRVAIRNYKSIAYCDVRLPQLAFFVGPNGSGKSNFLDALRFVSDAVRTSLDHAIRDRGGIQEVRRRSGGHPTHFGMRFEFSLNSAAVGSYAFRIAARPRAAYEIQQEECVVHAIEPFGEEAYFRVKNGVVDVSAKVAPPAQKDRLYLVNAAGLPEFRAVYDAFSAMGFYNLNPNQIREPRSPDPGQLLLRDGSNLPSVLASLTREAPKVKERIEEYLAKVVPGIRRVDVKAIGPMETLEFRQFVPGSRDPWRFPAASMSDGTLRALGILVALFQRASHRDRLVSLVGIEEPEVALHPAAAGVLFDALVEAAEESQVLITSHSPDLLDDERLGTDEVFAVVSESGVTRMGHLDKVGLTALRDHLYTAGELLRLNQLIPDPQELRRQDAHQPELFNAR